MQLFSSRALRRIIRVCACVMAVSSRSLCSAAETQPDLSANTPTHCPTVFDGDYPRLFVTPRDKGELQKEIATVDFKKQAFDAIVKSLQVYVDRHQSDPQWILSRIPMNREPGKRYLGYTVHPPKQDQPGHIDGYGDAPVPTLRFGGNANMGLISDQVSAPSLEQLTPNASDRFNVLGIDPDTGKKALREVDVNIARLTFETTYEQLETMARQSAYVYWITGDEKYARFASDIVLTFADAIAYMKPLNGEPGHEPGSSERFQIGNVFTNQYLAILLAQSMDYLHDYFVQQHTNLLNYERAMKNVASLMPLMADPHNIQVGCNLTKLELAMSMAGDKLWSARYLKETLDGVTAQASHLDKNGVWIEPCAYSDYTIAWFMKILWVGYNNHLSVIDRFPQIYNSGTSQLRSMFPNSVYMGDGDDWSAYPRVWVIEPALTIAHRTGNTALEQKLSQYISLMMVNGIYKSRADVPDPLDAINVFVPDLKYPASGSLPLAASVRDDIREYLSLRNLPVPQGGFNLSSKEIADRNATQAENGLQANLYGTLQGKAHRHQQGITLELYGCGHCLGLDPGPGEDAYAGPIQNYFSTRWAAHNTVIVDGASTGCPDLTQRIMEPDEGQSPVSKSFSFMQGDSVDPNSGKKQHRLVLMSRTSPSSGYYVDVYHSAGEGKNEYLYHNVGNSIDVLDQGQPVSPSPAPDELLDDSQHSKASIVGYQYLQEKHRFSIGEDDVQVRFNAPYPNDNDPVHMLIYLPGGPGRMLLSAMSPGKAAHRAFGGFEGKPLPTLIVRQIGEAWNRPFVAVYEPYRGNHQTVTGVSRITDMQKTSACVALNVASQPDNQTDKITDKIFTSADSGSRLEAENCSFQGFCAAVRLSGQRPVEMYLGLGKLLQAGNYRLEATTSDGAACLVLPVNEPPHLSSTSEFRITLPLPQAAVGSTHPIQIVMPGKTSTVTAVSESAGFMSATIPPVQGATIIVQQ